MTEMLEGQAVADTPFEQRLYTLEEIVLFFDGHDWQGEEEEPTEEDFRGWLEHMDAGECWIGRVPA